MDFRVSVSKTGILMIEDLENRILVLRGEEIIATERGEGFVISPRSQFVSLDSELFDRIYDHAEQVKRGAHIGNYKPTEDVALLENNLQRRGLNLGSYFVRKSLNPTIVRRKRYKPNEYDPLMD